MKAIQLPLLKKKNSVGSSGVTWTSDKGGSVLNQLSVSWLCFLLYQLYCCTSSFDIVENRALKAPGSYKLAASEGDILPGIHITAGIA